MYTKQEIFNEIIKEGEGTCVYILDGGKYDCKKSNDALSQWCKVCLCKDLKDVEISMPDDSLWDATDGAHPAWWRGSDHGCKMTCEVLNRVLDEGHPGTFGGTELEALAKRLVKIRDKELEDRCI